MPWEDTVETGRIVRAGYAAEGTAGPARPALGTPLNWADNASGGALFGWTPSTFYFTEDDFEFTDQEGNPIVVKPPALPQKIATIRDDVDDPESIVWTTYDVGSRIYSWATNVATTAGLSVKGAVHTRLALLIEIGAVGYHWMPSVEIKVSTPKGGFKTTSTQVIMADIFHHVASSTGYKYQAYGS